MDSNLADPHPTDAINRDLVAGFALLVLGVSAIGFSTATSFMTVFLLGLALVLGGAAQAVHGYWRWRARERIGFLLSGALAMIVGLVLIARPLVSLRAVTPLLLALFFADGVFLIASAVLRRKPWWGVRLAAGVITLGLGVLLATVGRATSLWLAGTLVGILLISRGLEMLADGIRAHAALATFARRRRR